MSPNASRRDFFKSTGAVSAAAMLGGVGAGLTDVVPVGLDEANGVDGGNVQGIARLLFTDYLVAFEVTSALLITAALGAMVLAHRERWLPRASQEELSKARFIVTGHPGNLPSSGTYARHNAVDTPALLPDGSPSAQSIPGPLVARGDVRPVDHHEVEQIESLDGGPK